MTKLLFSNANIENNQLVVYFGKHQNLITAVAEVYLSSVKVIAEPENNKKNYLKIIKNTNTHIFYLVVVFSPICEYNTSL